MDVFVGNLPNGVDAAEVQALFRPYGRNTHFRLVRTIGTDGAVHLFAHGVILPDRSGRRAIARLNGRRLHGRALVVRAYVHRAYGNERRTLDWRQRPWPWTERRGGERRLRRELRSADLEPRPPVDSPWYVGWTDVDLEELNSLRVEAYASFAVKHRA